MYARKLEKWCWEYIQNNKSIDINSIFKNGEFVENNIQERIKLNIAQYLTDCKMKRKLYLDEIRENLQSQLKNTYLSYISSNIEKLHQTCGELIANMLAMILMIEAKNAASSK